jgi:hypothetical protein
VSAPSERQHHVRQHAVADRVDLAVAHLLHVDGDVDRLVRHEGHADDPVRRHVEVALSGEEPFVLAELAHPHLALVRRADRQLLRETSDVADAHAHAERLAVIAVVSARGVHREAR